MSRECGGNVQETGVINVTASSCAAGKIHSVVDLGSDSWFRSKNGPHSWICYDFKGMRVKPTSYSIRTAESCFPKSWVLEVSNDGDAGMWIGIDSREGNEDLNAKHVTRNFAIALAPNKAFRFLRLRQTGKNHDGNDALELCSLEIFGTVSRE